jgi:hypothetical protein
MCLIKSTNDFCTRTFFHLLNLLLDSYMKKQERIWYLISSNLVANSALFKIVISPVKFCWNLCSAQTEFPFLQMCGKLNRFIEFLLLSLFALHFNYFFSSIHIILYIGAFESFVLLRREYLRRKLWKYLIVRKENEVIGAEMTYRYL